MSNQTAEPLCNVFVQKMDARPIDEEVHDYAEGLLVIDGILKLGVPNDLITVRAGELYIVKAGVRHTVEEGSAGTLVIIDLVEQVAG